MSKKKKANQKSQQNDNLYLSIATICERALEEKDGVVSLIRLLDRVMVTLPKDVPPDYLSSVPLNIHLFIGFKSHNLEAKKFVTVLITSPGGNEKLVTESPLPLILSKESSGANLILQITIVNTKVGDSVRVEETMSLSHLDFYDRRNIHTDRVRFQTPIAERNHCYLYAYSKRTGQANPQTHQVIHYSPRSLRVVQ